MAKDAQLLTSPSAAPTLDLAPPKAWRRLIPSWLRSLIWVDSIEKYDAFLSYSWKSDNHVAPVVQSVIQKFLCPWYKFRAKSVFRDLSSLPAGSSLEAELCDRLDRSTHLIVLASPEAKVSYGMEIEARHWFSRPQEGQVLVLISAGKFTTWEEGRDLLLPPALAKNLKAEPLWIPLQHRREGMLANPNDPQLRGELTEDLKQLLLRFYPGRDWDQLRGQERAQRQRTRWLVSGVFILLLTLLGFAVHFWWSAGKQRDQARTQLLAIQARRVERDQDHQLAAALALESIWLARKSNVALEADASEIVMSRLMEPSALSFLHGRLVTSVTALSDNRLASGGRDGTIKLWPKDGAGEPMVLSHGLEDVTALAILPDGRLASGSDDGTIKLWSRDGNSERLLTHGSRGVSALVALPDGRLASGSGDGIIKLWPRDGLGEPVIRRHQNYGGVVSLAVLPGGQLVSGGWYGTIKIWPEKSMDKPVELKHGDQMVIAMTVLSDGRLVSGSLDGTIKFWSMEWKIDRVIQTKGVEGVSFLAALPDGRLVSGKSDGTITVWPFDEEDDPVIFGSNSGLMTSLAVLPDGRPVSGYDDGMLRIWFKEEPIVLSDGDMLIQQLAMLPDGRLVSSDVERIKIWPKDGVGRPLMFPFDNNFVSDFVVLPDGRVASSGYYGTITLWPNDPKGEKVVLDHGQDNKSVQLAVLSDGRLVSHSTDDRIKVWPKDGKGDPLVLSHGSPVVSIAALPGGRLASASSDGAIKLWPMDGKGDSMLLTHGSKMVSLQALPDGRLVSEGGGKVKVWPADGKGDPVVTHDSLGVSLQVLPDGRIAGILDGKIQLFPKDGKGKTVILSHSSEKEKVTSIVVLPDGRLAASSDYGKIRLWLVDEQRLIAALCLRAGRNLSKDEWVRYIGPDTPWQPSCRNLPSNWRTPD